MLMLPTRQDKESMNETPSPRKRQRSKNETLGRNSLLLIGRGSLTLFLRFHIFLAAFRTNTALSKTPSMVVVNTGLWRQRMSLMLQKVPRARARKMLCSSQKIRRLAKSALTHQFWKTKMQRAQITGDTSPFCVLSEKHRLHLNSIPVKTCSSSNTAVAVPQHMMIVGCVRQKVTSNIMHQTGVFSAPGRCVRDCMLERRITVR